MILSQQELFRHTLQELEWAYEIGLHLYSAYRITNESDKKCCHDDVAATIQKRITSLLDTSQNVQRIMLPGGYNGKDPNNGLILQGCEKMESREGASSKRGP